jgi:hypothetical protein
MATVFLPNTFVAGTPAVATEVNQNFTAITDQVNGNLDADNLIDGAVTAGKLAANAVTSSKIANSQVTNDKVASGIDATKIADGSVSNIEFQYLSGVTSDIQTQIDDAIELTSSGKISSTGVATSLPSGWSSSLSGNLFTVNHTLGTALFDVVLSIQSAATPYIPVINTVTSTTFTFYVLTTAGGFVTSGTHSIMFVTHVR